jgi:hypothetical protein
MADINVENLSLKSATFYIYGIITQNGMKRGKCGSRHVGNKSQSELVMCILSFCVY